MGTNIITPKLVLGNPVKREIYNSVYSPVGGSVWNSVNDSLKSLTKESIRGLVYSPLSNSVWRSVKNLIYDSIRI
jgi:hypothetical protein